MVATAALAYRAMYDFVAEEEGEMSVGVGDELYQTEADAAEESPPAGWLFVRGKAGCGYVPRDFLAQVRPELEEATVPTARAGAAEAIAPASPAAATTVANKTTASAIFMTNSSPPVSPSSERGGALSDSSLFSISHDGTLALASPAPSPRRSPEVHETPAAPLANTNTVDISRLIPQPPRCDEAATLSQSRSAVFNSPAGSVYGRSRAGGDSSDLMDITRRAESLLETILSAQSEVMTDLSVVSRQAAKTSQSTDELLRSITQVEAAIESELAALSVSE